MIVIDPSVRACGWARFIGPAPHMCGVIQGKDLLDTAYKLRDVFAKAHGPCIIERPRIYPHSPVPPNDIATLSIVVGEAIATAIEHGLSVKLVHPTQQNKTVTEHRVRKRLTNLDAMLHGIPKSLQHNAIDAIALGFREVGI